MCSLISHLMFKKNEANSVMKSILSTRNIVAFFLDDLADYSLMWAYAFGHFALSAAHSNGTL